VAERLDSNHDGVVSRSEFADWLWPTRALGEVLDELKSVVDSRFDGKVNGFFAALTDASAASRLDVSVRLRALGCRLSPAEVDALLGAAGPEFKVAPGVKGGARKAPKRQTMTLSQLCAVLGRSVEEPLAAQTPSRSPPRKKAAKKTVLKPKADPPPPPPPPKRRVSSAFSQSSTPNELAKRRAEQRDAVQRGASSRRGADAPLDDLPDDAPPAVRRGLARLQAAARGSPCRSLHESMRREAVRGRA